MLPEEAIDRIEKRICSEPEQRHCRDKCLYGVEACEFSMAREALEKQVPMAIIRFIRKKTEELLAIGDCPNCGRLVIESTRYCSYCGQRLKWGD